jgi:erythromycin esterase-like protein
MLKNRIIFLLCLLATILCFNGFYHYTNLENDDEKRLQLKSCLHPINDDFSFLAHELQNKRIVVLGEQSHWDGTTFVMKEKIISYLHENLDFDVVLYEAGLYDMWQMATQKDSLNPQTGLYPFWWNNEETKSLWKYYEKEKISLGGFDIQLTGDISDSVRIKNLTNYLIVNDLNLNNYPHFLHFSKDIRRYMTWWDVFSKQFTNRQKDSILIEMKEIALKIKQISNPTVEDKIYYRYLSGLAQRFESISVYPKIGAPTRMQVRDSLMADNLIWLADSIFPNKKIIVWMANIHAIHPGNNRYFPWKTTGQYLKAHYKQAMYTVVFSSYRRLNEYGCLSNTMGNKSLEYLLHNMYIPYAYIPTNVIPENSFFKQEFVSGINQGMNQKSDWYSMLDLYIFIDTMQSVTPLKDNP